MPNVVKLSVIIMKVTMPSVEVSSKELSQLWLPFDKAKDVWIVSFGATTISPTTVALMAFVLTIYLFWHLFRWHLFLCFLLGQCVF